MVDGPFPDRLERCRAELDDRRAVCQLVADDGAIASEMTQADQAVDENPEVVAGQRDVGRAPPGQPSHLLPGGYVHGVRYLVLEPDVRRHRLGDDAGPADRGPPPPRPAEAGAAPAL